MDARLLNVYHDDPFDGSFTPANTDFWHNENDTLGQLTETLNGILPISIENDTDVYTHHLLATEDNFRISTNFDGLANVNNKELLIYEDFKQHQLDVDGNIEIITVNPNSLDSDTSDNSDNNENDDDIDGFQDVKKYSNNIGMDYIEFDDNQSQYSDATFRTRTDSSSIGDYESHTSDYDDSSEEDDNENASKMKNGLAAADMKNKSKTGLKLPIVDEIPDLAAGLLDADEIELGAGYDLPLEDIAVANKNRTLSTNTIGLELASNNFDLAEFITNDNFNFNASKIVEKNESKTQTNINVPSNRLAIPVKKKFINDMDYSDVDSDVIVDIETVDLDIDVDKTLRKIPKEKAKVLNEKDMSYEDNIQKDPSWSPKAARKQESAAKEAKVRTTGTSTTPPNTSKNIEKSRSFTIVPNKRQCDILKGKAITGKNKSTTKPTQGKSITKKGPETTAGNVAKAGSLTCRVGVGQTQNSKADDKGKLKTKQPSEEKLDVSTSINKESKETQKLQVTLKENVKTVDQTKIVVKRKLNLEEYKQRRGENSSAGSNNNAKAEKLNSNKSSLQNTQVKHSVEVTSVVNSLRNQVSQKSATDPITEAKNKVLRMQELKRAQQLKIIDSTISAKVPRVTKLPPLKEIVKDTYMDIDQQNESATSTKWHLDYEELIIVSVESNTDISIPPLNILPINTCERSLLKSSALLYKLPNGVPSNSSLISSIQGVVVQKVIRPEKSGKNKCVSAKTQKVVEQHGEDKVIMHLRKDRIRPNCVNMGTQTDLQPGFDALPKIAVKKQKRTKRNYRKNDKTSLYDSDSDVSGLRSHNRKRNQSHSPVNRSRSRSYDSYASSMERAGGRHGDTTTYGGYSSRSSRRHRSSISSSYSESERMSRKLNRQQHTNCSQRTKIYSRNSSSSSSLESTFSDRSRSRTRSRNRNHSRSRSRSHSLTNSRNYNRSRSRSPYFRRSYSRSRSRSRSISRSVSNRFRKPGGNRKPANNISQPAVEERRIVYVGRIEEETTKEMLRKKFLPYGIIKHISIHYKDTGMKYGFVTYERSQDAFTVIDGSARDPTINMYDISFGGRRAFCRSSYADLDNAGINTYHSIVFPKIESPPKEEDSFEALLQKVKAKMNANKANTHTKTHPTKA